LSIKGEHFALPLFFIFCALDENLFPHVMVNPNQNYPNPPKDTADVVAKFSRLTTGRAIARSNDTTSVMVVNKPGSGTRRTVQLTALRLSSFVTAEHGQGNQICNAL
jgi:hypothetical protein